MNKKAQELAKKLSHEVMARYDAESILSELLGGNLKND